jgi:hypothetical protein
VHQETEVTRTKPVDGILGAVLLTVTRDKNHANPFLKSGIIKKIGLNMVSFKTNADDPID